jgi:hypothetical protein
MGVFIGQNINPTIFNAVDATIKSFLNTLVQQGLLSTTTSGGLPFSVVCAFSNNPFARTSIGYLQADVQVQYMAIVKNFIVNLQGGSTVTVSHS